MNRDEIRILLLHEREMVKCEDELNRQVAALILERVVVGHGGAWGEDTERLAELTHAQAALRAFPPWRDPGPPT